MRLLKLGKHGRLTLTEDLPKDALPPYAILSHTWGSDKDEVTFHDVEHGRGKSKVGYKKLQFCMKQAQKDGLQHFWADTCCINKASLSELSESITSMFRWYQNAVKCYVYLSDITVKDRDNQYIWESEFRKSRWFTRGWTLQELLAPKSVEFFSREGEILGTKDSLEHQIHEITGIPSAALHMTPLSNFSIDERLRWAEKRTTTKPEDKAYCLLGIFEVFMPLIYGEGENAFNRLKEEIDKHSGSSAALTHVHWMVTRPINPLFTGREDLLQDLEGIVREVLKRPSDQKQCRIVISGMGGQGKSETSLQLAFRLRQMFWGVFWIDFSTTDLAERSFLDVAQRLSIPARTWEDACLSIANLKHPWLLVLDNADDPEIDYQHYIPSGSSGVVILTSRNDQCLQYATSRSVALKGLVDEEAQELLLKAARVPQDQYNVLRRDAEAVARLLQSHPLALIQAGAYISRSHCTLADYPRIYGRQRLRLLTFRPAQARSRYRDVYATFEVSADVLKNSATEAARDALLLLPLLAVGGPSRLPLPIFEAAWRGAQSVSKDMDDDTEDDDVILLTSWHVRHLPSLAQVEHDTWDSFQLVEAVQLLKAFSLVSTDSEGEYLSVSMHPLVHAWARDRQNDQERHKNWLQMACLIAVAKKEVTVWRKQARQLQSHIETLVAWDFNVMFSHEPAVMVTRALMRCGWLLHDMRSDTKLFMLMETIFNRLKLDRLSVDCRWVGAYDLRGINLVNYGNAREATIALEAVVMIRERQLAEDHPVRLASQRGLAIAYGMNGQPKKALILLKEVFKIRKQLLTADHRDRLTSQYELAIAYKLNGQSKEAAALLEEVYHIRKQSLAADHPDLLDSQHELAKIYEINGQVREAVALLEEVVKIEEQILAEDHPDRLDSEQSLATVYAANFQISEALLLIERVFKIRQQVLKKDHPRRLTSQHELARIYMIDGQIMNAVSQLEMVVDVKRQIYSEDHPNQLASKHMLAVAYRQVGRAEEAVVLLEQVVKIEEQILAEDHPSRLTSLCNLAVAYQEIGRIEEAVALLEQVVKIEEQTKAENHPSRLTSQCHLAIAYREIGRIKEAVALLEQVVKIEERTLAEDNPSRLSSQHHLARVYQINGQVKEAVVLLEQVVKIEEQTQAEDNPSRLSSQYHLARAYQMNGQVKEAVVLLEQVVKIEEQTLAEHDPDRLASLRELAKVYQLNGQAKEAMAISEQVVKIQDHTGGESLVTTGITA